VASSSKAQEPRPFDVQTVEHLIGLMAKHDLSEIALVEGDHRIRLRKAVPPVVHAVATHAAPVHHAPAQVAAPAVSAPATPAAPTKKLHEIKSVMVGTFYTRPKPEKDEYVKVGTVLKADTTICQIEAMKIFNEIKAECTGTVAEVCVKNGDAVDFGTVLFRIEN
jgi:acetyl-CoA carboxylase biotin carboxyl carrier protein